MKGKGIILLLLFTQTNIYVSSVCQRTQFPSLLISQTLQLLCSQRREVLVDLLEARTNQNNQKFCSLLISRTLQLQCNQRREVKFHVKFSQTTTEILLKVLVEVSDVLVGNQTKVEGGAVDRILPEAAAEGGAGHGMLPGTLR